MMVKQKGSKYRRWTMIHVIVVSLLFLLMLQQFITFRNNDEVLVLNSTHHSFGFFKDNTTVCEPREISFRAIEQIRQNHAKMVKINNTTDMGDASITLNDRILKNLKDLNEKQLCLSYKQHKNIFLRKDKVIAWAKNNQTNDDAQSLLYPIQRGKYNDYYAYILNDKYAFLHIFKNGGSSVEAQLGRGTGSHVRPSQVKKRGLLATLRDPIDHFLSGWSECGSRHKLPHTSIDTTFDERIQMWLDHINSCRNNRAGFSFKGACACIEHSLPQVNFLLKLFTGNEIDPKIDLLGDLKELPELLRFAGFQYKNSIPSARVHAKRKSNHKYPRNRTLISMETMRNVCHFLRLDYYLLQFEPPPICHEQIKSDLKLINDFSFD